MNREGDPAFEKAVDRSLTATMKSGEVVRL